MQVVMAAGIFGNPSLLSIQQRDWLPCPLCPAGLSSKDRAAAGMPARTRWLFCRLLLGWETVFTFLGFDKSPSVGTGAAVCSVQCSLCLHCCGRAGGRVVVSSAMARVNIDQAATKLDRRAGPGRAAPQTQLQPRYTGAVAGPGAAVTDVPRHDTTGRPATISTRHTSQCQNEDNDENDKISMKRIS